ncbi:DUF4229 domain-containing protein [Salininema proteolyticum]|uniref:DUF4229 domain-containing protein n=1 Tax=Salininema proteolyticum TaxID=1607685 RepID=A0ABV8U389_9ACTN
MNPTLAYLGARLGLFVACVIPALLFIDNLFLALTLSVVVSMILSMVLLKKLREAMITSIDGRIKERREAKEKLRKEFAGE